MGKLDGKVAVITGSSRGLGLAVARAYAAEGANVIISSRSNTTLEELASQMRGQGWTVFGKTADVSTREDMEALAAFALEKFGKIDVWMNNAGATGPYGPTDGLDPQVFAGVVQTNIMGTYFGSMAALRVFKSQGYGKLINMLGMGYKKPAPFQNVYGSSKVWIRHFTKALAEENRPLKGIGIFTFNPGMVLTDLLTHFEVVSGSEERLKIFPTIVRMWAKPAEIPAQKAVWLASSATDFKTGVEGNAFSQWVVLKGAMREGFRRLFGKKPPEQDIQMKIIKPWHPEKG
jgi:NAD(P)-dependent dehydrogenase (short-subunit alcohol dehydrogenase family)